MIKFNDPVNEILNKIDELEKQKDHYIKVPNYTQASKLNDKIKKLERELHDIYIKQGTKVIEKLLKG